MQILRGRAEPKQDRLHVLDGLRGVAILFVVLNHVPAIPLFDAAPSWFDPFIGLIFRNGIVGVSILFVLCGYLMARLYKNPEPLVFIQKRYSRIFPLFLTMCFFMWVLRNAPEIPLVLLSFLLLVIPIIVHVFWVYGIRKIPHENFTKWIFFGFLTAQALCALTYIIFVNRFSPEFFYQVIPQWSREIIIYSTNAFLIFPLGTFTPMLDGVYWTLAAEVIFYLLYPILYAPVSNLLEKHRLLKVLFLLSLVPLHIALYLCFNHIESLRVLIVSMYFYFIGGITLAYSQDTLTSSRIFQSNTTRAVLFIASGVFILEPFIYPVLQDNALARIALCIPTTVFIALLITKTNLVSNFLSNRYFVGIGTISYSIYLSHSAVVKLLERTYQPGGIWDTALFVIAILCLCLVFSSYLYFLLERPYFLGRKKTQKIVYLYSQKFLLAMVLTVWTLFFWSIMIAFDKSTNVFVFKSNHPFEVQQQVEPSRELVLGTDPISFELEAQYDNFGIFTSHIRRIEGAQVKTNEPTEDQFLQFRIRQKGGENWHSTSNHRLSAIRNDENYPFGFPTIADSRGKKYEIEFSLTNPKNPDRLAIHLEKGLGVSIYPVQKKEILKNPTKALAIVANRVMFVFEQKEAKHIALLGLPSLLLLTFLCINRFRSQI